MFESDWSGGVDSFSVSAAPMILQPQIKFYINALRCDLPRVLPLLSPQASSHVTLMDKRYGWMDGWMESKIFVCRVVWSRLAINLHCFL